MHTEHQNRHHDGANNDPAVYGLAVFIRDTAYGGMRQADDAETDQHPERGHESRREDIIGAVWRYQLRIDLLERFYRLMQATGGMDYANQQDDRSDQHHHPLHGIVEYAGAEAPKAV